MIRFDREKPRSISSSCQVWVGDNLCWEGHCAWVHSGELQPYRIA